MSLDTYANFKTAIADQLARSDLTSQIVDCIRLFEAEALMELFRAETASGIGISVVHPNIGPTMTISGAADNGSGAIRLTVDDSSQFTSGHVVVVENVTGTTEANGVWVFTTISATTIDLVDSTFANTYSSGGTVKQLLGYAALPSDFMGAISVAYTGNPSFELEFVDPGILTSQYPSFGTIAGTAGLPRVYSIVDGYLRIAGADTTGILLTYWRKGTAAETSLDWLFTNHIDCYWNGTLEQVYSYLKDYDQAAVYQQKKMLNYSNIKMKQFRERAGMRIRTDRSSYGATP